MNLDHVERVLVADMEDIHMEDMEDIHMEGMDMGEMIMVVDTTIEDTVMVRISLLLHM